ncbi:hypothetical protein Q3G72_002198 [Acer saccharum]|nr:hypothetical protein Q3G72_002198 [Acer saccharum]
MVKVMEEATKVEGKWVETYLGLKKVDSQHKGFSDLSGQCNGGYAEEEGGAVGGTHSPRRQHREKENEAQETIGRLQKVCQPSLVTVEEKRSPSLDEQLKEYLNKIEQAFVWANCKNGLGNHMEQNGQNQQSPREVTSDDNSVSVVEESRESSEVKSGEEQALVSSKSWSVPATKEDGVVEVEPKTKKQKRGKKSNSVHKSHSMKTRNAKNRGSENMATVVEGVTDDNRSGQYRRLKGMVAETIGVAAVNRNEQPHSGNNVVWNLDKEVAKIIEIGV